MVCQANYLHCSKIKFGVTKIFVCTTIIPNFNLYLPPTTKLRQGNIFTSVCQEFCPGGHAW